jgi:indolepyruvate ferredoxin oxidoreductase
MSSSNVLPKRQVRLDDKYTVQKGRAYMTGIEALVRLPMLQQQRDYQSGLNTAGFISGYRGSPLGGIDQALWQAQDLLKNQNIHFQPGINEELAATAVWGSQQNQLFEGSRFDGVFGLWYAKGPGVDRSMDVIKHANAFGTAPKGGVLAVAGDDHACKSSTLPNQSEHMFIGASVPVLAPANVQEVLDLGLFGWELSRFSGCWVALKAITENMDSAISADIDANRISIQIPEGFELPEGGVSARWPDKPLDQERRLNKYKIYAAREFARVNNLNPIVIDSPKPRLGIITSGKAYLDVLQALEDMGIDDSAAAEIGIRVYKVGMPWPLEPQQTHRFAEGLEEILVVEEKRSIIEDQLTSQLYNYPVGSRPRVVGEFDEHGSDLLPNLGELTPAMVAQAIAGRLRRFFSSPTLEERIRWIEEKEKSLAVPADTIERTPHFCSGCPHNTSTQVPGGSRALGGIGCHYMATWMPDRETHTFTQMGGEGATWIGQAPFTDTEHVFQNLGDGTYFHSGVLAIRAAVAAGVNITYKILYNEAVAMTGGQPLDGTLSVSDLLHQLRGEGVRRIALVSDQPDAFQGQFSDIPGFSLHPRENFDALQLELRDYKGTSVIVYQQLCATEKRRQRKKGKLTSTPRRVVINDAVCEGCGDCGAESNCLSVTPKDTLLGRKRQIDQNACNADLSCLKGFCPSFVSVVGGELQRPATDEQVVTLLPTLPEPDLPNLTAPWNIVVAGVGGTGVLTISSLLAMAAHIEGKGCATMNQTGLAQKFGAVTSHVRVAQQQEQIKAVRIPAGEADLLIGCDLVVTAGYECLAKAAEGRTHALVNVAEQATAAFLRDPDASFPTQGMKTKISREVGPELAFVNATEVALELLGDTIGANLFLMGCAWQKGWIPVSRAALIQAIEINNVAPDFNKEAFELGRHYAHSPDSVVQRFAPKSAAEQEPEKVTLDSLIEDRVARLTDYQNRTYAQQYQNHIASLRACDPKSELTGSLTWTAAEQLYRLMAIKDEYEVARLHSDPEFHRQLSEEFSGDYKLRFHLAPPILSRPDPSTGKITKREFGGWMLPIFSLLAQFKFLRGTIFDPFGYSAERRAERNDLRRYFDLLSIIMTKLETSNYEDAIALAKLPRGLRGFGYVRTKNRQQLLSEQEHLLARFLGTAPKNLVDAVAAA